jgi:methionyl-tRNA formyltransferase
VIAQELVDFVQDEKQEKVSDEIIDLVSQNKKIRLFKPSKIKKNQKFIEKLKELDPDYFVVISY